MSNPGGDSSRPRASRLSEVLDLLATRGRLSVADAVEHLGVSEATVRRDFTELARRQLVARNHGGVVATAVAYELPYRYRHSQGDDELDRIAAVAASLARPGTVVALNGGTTTSATARSLTAREDLSRDGVETTLVTNALNIASEAVLRSHVRVVSLGGVARRESYEVSGPLAAMVIGQLWVDLAIVGVDGFSADAGATCRHEDEAAIVRAIVERSESVCVVATANKVGRRTFASICAPERVATLVTTAPAEDPEVLALRGVGVDVRCV